MALPDPADTAPHSVLQTSSHTRLIEVLDALVRRDDGEPWGVRELAAELSESRSTVNRILVALVERGLALEIGTGKYTLGPRLTVLANSSSALNELDEGTQSLQQLAELANATALISICCPLSGGYFVAACGQAMSSLMFRPELGVLYPLSFGDIGRCIREVLPKQDVACNQRDVNGPALRGAFGALSESEFPAPLAISTKSLGNGLVVAVSVHSVNGQVSNKNDQIDKAVSRFADEMAMEVGSRLKRVKQIRSISAEDTKSTAVRLERLLLLAYASPEGWDDTAALNSLLLCNSVTCKRLIQSGIQTEVLSRVGNRLFPGPRLFQWASKIGQQTNIADLSRPTVQSLVQETGETIAILSYDETTQRATFLDVIQGWRPIQYQLAINTDVPLYAGAAGKAVLAFCSKEVANSIELIRITEATITSRPELETELKIIQDRGWATGTGERVLGAFGLAVPFFADGKIRGSISATIPQYRKDDRDLPRLTQLMLEASAKIGRLLSLGISR